MIQASRLLSYCQPYTRYLDICPSTLDKILVQIIWTNFYLLRFRLISVLWCRSREAGRPEKTRERRA